MKQVLLTPAILDLAFNTYLGHPETVLVYLRDIERCETTQNQNNRDHDETKFDAQ